MPETQLLPRTPFAGLADRGRFGRTFADAAPLTLTERTNVAFLQIVARKGAAYRLLAAVREETGLDLPQGPLRVKRNGLSFHGTGPGQWLAVAENEASLGLLQNVVRVLDGLASIVDVTDGKAVLRVSGPAARQVLAKGCSLDLHPSAFGEESTARTAIALIPCQIWQVDAAPSYDVAVDLSYAASFWHWITASAEEFGYEVAKPSAG